MAFAIRELGDSELEAVVPLRHAMIREIDGEDLDRSAPGWRERYVAFFRGHVSRGRGGVWVVEREGEIIAICAGYMPTNHRTEIVGSNQLYICNVYVKPQWRRKGIAKALTLHAVAWARGKGCDVVRLRTSEMGRPVYASVGFEQSAEMELFL
jgi:GNAT superfamily N-acetyltransferase